MAYWLYKSLKGEFSIMERSSKGVDAYFCGHHVGHFLNPVEAARAVAAGAYHLPPIFDGEEPPMDVPAEISKWLFVSLGDRNER